MPFSLPDGSYRLYNRDIQYPLNNPQGIYGAIPFLMGHGGQPATAGVLWSWLHLIPALVTPQ